MHNLQLTLKGVNNKTFYIELGPFVCSKRKPSPHEQSKTTLFFSILCFKLITQGLNVNEKKFTNHKTNYYHMIL